MPVRPIQYLFTLSASIVLAVAALLPAAQAVAGQPTELLQQLNAFPHARTVDTSETEVVDYEIGIGPIEKVSGSWRFKRSQRNSGLLTRYTWQIIDGFTSIEVMDELVAKLENNSASELLYSCDGRSCGQGVQWANRVFRQRILYGREELQRYRAYQLSDSEEGAPGDQYRLIIYSAARSADRQYLHVELLRINP